MGKMIPTSVADTLLHVKEDDKSERIILPITRYGNVMHAPKVVEDVEDAVGAPFAFLATDRELISVKDLRYYLGAESL